MLPGLGVLGLLTRSEIGTLTGLGEGEDALRRQSMESREIQKKAKSAVRPKQRLHMKP